MSSWQSVRIQDPSSCVGFAVNGSTYIGVTHSGPPFSPAANLSIFKLQKDLNLTLVSMTPTSVQRHYPVLTLQRGGTVLYYLLMV